jgi:hypothetical protein
MERNFEGGQKLKNRKNVYADEFCKDNEEEKTALMTNRFKEANLYF